MTDSEQGELRLLRSVPFRFARAWESSFERTIMLKRFILTQEGCAERKGSYGCKSKPDFANRER
jgi:hypothetical protein